MNELYYHFKIHKEGNGYWAHCVELEGCVTQGDTLEELRYNMNEALNLYLDEPEGSDISFPVPLIDRPIERVKVNDDIASKVWDKIIMDSAREVMETQEPVLKKLAD